MKKVLIIHTKYQHPGGEDVAVKNETELLKKHYEVKELYFENNIKNYLTQLLYFLTNRNLNSLINLKKILSTFNPDVVYIHNTWFKASPIIFSYLKKNNRKILLKIHNYRFFCTKYFFARNHFLNNYPCKACGSELRKNSLFNRYYKKSILKSFFLIIYGKKYFKILKNDDIKILTLNEFQKQYLIENGVPSSKIYIHNNYLESKITNFYNSSSQYFVYAGRVSNEKGLFLLIESFLKTELKNYTLKIIGDGPLLKDLIYKNKAKNIEFLGQLSNEKTIEIIKQARAVVTATHLLEVQPTLLCEASINSIPSIFPNNGGIIEYFPKNYPLVFKNNDQSQLIKMFNLTRSEEFMKIMSFDVKSKIDKVLNEENYIKNFEKIINE